MATKAISLALTKVNSPSYRGWKKHLDGKRYYLGEDEDEATVRLLQIIAHVRFGVELLREGEVTAKPQTSVITVHQAIKLNQEAVRQSGLAPTWKPSAVAYLDVLRRAFPEKLLRDVDQNDLSTFVQKYLSLPLSVRGKPVSPTYAKNVIKAGQRFFRWCEDTGRWTGPHNWIRIFSVRGKLRIRISVHVPRISDVAKAYKADVLNLIPQLSPRSLDLVHQPALRSAA